MRVLLVAVHGSRVEAANGELLALADVIAGTHADRWGQVAIGFLEFGGPTLQQALDDLVAAGAKTITVVPLFLSSGRHVGADIPRLLTEFGDRHADIEIRTTQHFGAWHGLAGAVAALAREAEESATRPAQW